jgi:hypothetical protein
MSCQFVQESRSSYLDDRLPEPERMAVAQHVAACHQCAAVHRRTTQVRKNLRSMSLALAPARLETDLRVMASKEVVRRRHMGSLSAWMRYWAENARLVIDNLMRPLALPFAGGFATALLCFAMLVPSLGFLRSPANDRPTALYTEPSVDNVADFASKSNEDTLLEVQIDGQGRMVDYSVLQGQMSSDVGNFLLFTTYTPATMFLQPTSSKIFIRRSRIVVKG